MMRPFPNMEEVGSSVLGSVDIEYGQSSNNENSMTTINTERSDVVEPNVVTTIKDHKEK